MYKKLKELRIKKGYTTEDMAKKIGISKPFYSQIENQKRRLSYDNAVKIAAIFNKKPDYIFYEDFNEKN
ncbi:MAG: helix-turn-helix transcriptional regulator [Bacilli bacterium]|nr:helix-turn-helix transcriptional regulator [Bacilli bacterium]